MKKSFKSYIVVWASLLALFNLTAFLIPALPDQDKYTKSFWIGYVLITLISVGHLYCASKIFNSKSARSTFYNIPLTRISFIGTVISFVVGIIVMMTPKMPGWLGVIIAATTLVVNIIALFTPRIAIEEIERIDQKVKTQTFFIKSLTVDADTLMAKAKTDEIKAECRKVYEAVRYSDPMSNDALSAIEQEISQKFSELSNAVVAGNFEAVSIAADEVIVLIGNRNGKCKILK